MFLFITSYGSVNENATMIFVIHLNAYCICSRIPIIGLRNSHILRYGDKLMGGGGGGGCLAVLEILVGG